jgi:ADP-ribose pyrophosphatase YjhB (NUDIX family)
MMPVTNIRRKVYVYITYQGKLLIFSHPDFPEASLQVPGGTVKPGEAPEAAAWREAVEETGLQGLHLVRCLGEQVRDMADCGLDEIHQRTFFHFECTQAPPEVWRHNEADPSDGSLAPIVFELFWIRLPGAVPPLISQQDYLLPRLVELLHREDE